MPEITIPITKGKAGMVVDTDKLPDEVFREIVLQGCKAVFNRGMSKITAETYPNETERKAAAMAQAQKNLEAALEGKIRITGGKAKKATGAIMTEARRLARQAVKDAIKADGGKISHYEASEITKAANALIEEDPTFLQQAEANVKERSEKPTKTGVLSLIKVSEKKVAAAEAKKKKVAPGQLSAKQAGLTAKVRPGQRPNA